MLLSDTVMDVAAEGDDSDTVPLDVTPTPAWISTLPPTAADEVPAVIETGAPVVADVPG